MGPRAWKAEVRAIAASCVLVAMGCSRSGSEAAGGGSGHDAGASECASLPPLAQKPAYTIGFAQVYEPTNPYTLANTADVLAVAAKRGYKVVYTPPASADVADQLTRTQALIAARVDAIIVRPVAGLGPAVVEARKACIPVFTEGRLLGAGVVPGTDYVSHIGTDSTIQGRLIADWLIKTTHGRATVIELEGTPGASPTLGRKKGFDEQIAGQPGMNIVASETGNFDRAKGHEVAKKLMTQYPTATVVYAHNDYMALGALEATKEVGKVAGKDIIIVSVDGLKEAVQRVIDGTIAAIEFNDPKLAATSFDTMEKYAAGQVIPPKVVVRGPVIDHTNAAAMIAEAF